MVKLKFDEESHTYSLGKRKLQSVTEWISGFFPKFDEEAVAKKVANKQGVPPEQILQDWLDIREAGTKIHKEIEDWFNSRTQPTENKAKRAIDWTILSSMWREYPMKSTEVQIYSEKFGLAGTIDLLMVKQDDYTKQRAVLVDWKTNAQIRAQNTFEYTDSTGELAFLHNSSLVKYMLQLSTYALMLEEEYDTLIDSLLIVHLKDDMYVEIPVDYLKETVKKMMRDRR